jgi:DNA-binding NarL/FixJ family response regulator
MNLKFVHTEEKLAERDSRKQSERSACCTADTGVSTASPGWLQDILQPGESPERRSPVRAGHELAGWSPRPTELGSSALAWSVAEERRSIKDARLLIIDDCTLHRESLSSTFAANGMVAPRVAWDLHSLMAVLETGFPSVILLSIGTRDSLMLLQSALRIRPDIPVIVLGVLDDDEMTIVACAEAGIAGYHLRSESLTDLIALICKIADGEAVCPPRVSAILLRRLSALAAERSPAGEELVLTEREIQILSLLELGLSNREIAARLCIAVHTVKNHVHSVLTKLGVSNRAEAASRFRALGFTVSGSEN